MAEPKFPKTIMESWRTSLSIRPLKWTPLGPVLALLLLGHGFADNLEYGIGHHWRVPDGQPAQMSSRVEYDSKLTDPFFESNEWSYPDYIHEQPDGGFVDISSGERLKDPPRLKHTANCVYTAEGDEHMISFCQARLPDVNMMDLLIHESSPSSDDALMVQIKNGMFTCQYSAIYVVYSPESVKWTTKRQKLTLDRRVYTKGDLIKGRIDFECEQKCGKDTCTIKINGAFKTIVE